MSSNWKVVSTKRAFKRVEVTTTKKLTIDEWHKKATTVFEELFS